MIKTKLKLKKSIFNKIIISILIVLMIGLFYATYYIYRVNHEIGYYKKNSNQYGYIIISEMSNTFATIGGKELHFAKDSDNIYVIATLKNDNKFKKIIKYTYENKEKTKSVKTYVYPVKMNSKIKKLAIKNVNKFLSYDTKVNISKKNYKKYFGNNYLDTSIKYKYKFNYVVFILFLIVFGIFGIVRFLVKRK